MPPEPRGLESLHGLHFVVGVPNHSGAAMDTCHGHAWSSMVTREASPGSIVQEARSSVVLAPLGTALGRWDILFAIFSFLVCERALQRAPRAEWR